MDASVVENASIYKRIHPHSYLSRFLANHVRPDGRSFDAFRPVDVNTGSVSTADGSSLVRIGEMTVICTIRAEVAEPDVMAPTLGFITPNVDLPPLCSSKFKQGPPSEDAMTASACIKSILHSSNILPLDTLVIEPEKAVWSICVDITCLNYDGNAVDASMIAIITALSSTTVPTPTYDPDTGITSGDASNRIPLQLGDPALSFTFVVFESAILNDPTAFEESMATTTTTITINSKGCISGMFHAGTGLTTSDLKKCIKAAQSRYKEIAGII